ncbi:MAG TPA: flagellar filament capping protein FliD [Tepidisphaeraceae bacterium]|nr:flagellar filament capping protein FliD [Tepidisphaeraceae bacterium]
MGRISTGIGLISGINSRDIIDQLMSIEARPKTALQTRIDSINQQKLAYTDLSTRLTSLKLSSTTLKKSTTFQNATTTSSNEDVLTATASAGAAVGSYQFQVARLVTTQQSVSRGFADFDSAKVGAGTITIEMGGGGLKTENLLSELRGGQGIRRGVFKITDRSGATAIIDTTAAVTLDDVVRRINTSLEISVRAQIDGDRLVLTDLTGKTSSDLIVQDVGEGQTAADLGIAGSVAGNTLTGSDINFLGRATGLGQLNDGRGVRTASSGDDFAIQTADGSVINVSLAGARTLGEVIDKINTAAAGKVTAEIVAGANGLRLTDQTSGASAFAVTALNGSKAAADLGIEKTAAGSTLDGSTILAGLGTVLVSSLNGGQGFTLGTISVKSRAAATATDIDLSGATTVADIISTINAANAGVKASLNAAGNGIQITDTSGGSGALIIGDTSGTTAADFGIAGTFDLNTPVARGKNLQLQWVHENTLLADLNGGKGITPGRFRITNSAGVSATIDLTQGNEVRLADVIAEINSKGIGVVASINATGDGLLLTDTAGGSAGKLTVQDIEGTAAADLNIKGTASTTTLDGSYEKTITVAATDALQDVQKKINDLGWGVSAQIINDGSVAAPYRLSLMARNPGRNGRVTFDAGATTLDIRTLVEAQDAAVFVGDASAEQPLLITASRNQLAGVVKGVNIELHGVSDKPVTLGVTRSIDNVVSEIQKFTDTFNQMVDKLKELTKFDTKTNTRGLLLGEGAAQTIETEIYAMLNTVNASAGRYRVLADVGLSLGEGAKLVFDEDKLRQAYATDPQAVENLFTSIESVTAEDGKTTLKTTGLAHVFESRISRLIDPVNGVITRENKTLDSRTEQFQDRIAALDKLLEQKRARLERQFANLESVLAGLQSQQQAIGQIQAIRLPSSS